jgi:ribonuclease E
VPVDVALYILNSKRHTLSGLEAKYGLSITIVADDHVGPQHYVIEKGEARLVQGGEQPAQHVRVDSAAIEAADIDDDAVEDEEEEAAEGEPRQSRDRADENGDRQGRRRRRRGGRGREERPRQPALATAEPSDDVQDAEAADEGEEAISASAAPRDENGNGERRRRRRGRRGGRRNRREGEGNGEVRETNGVESAVPMSDDGTDRVVAAVLAQDAIAEDSGVEPDISVAEPEEGEAKPRRARRSRKAADAEANVQDAVTAEAEAAPRGRSRRPKAAPPTEDEAIESAEAIAVAAPEPVADIPVAEEAPRRPRKELPPEGIVVSSTSAPAEETKPKKAGWWQRGFFGS